MAHPSGGHPIDDERLVQYLLGALSEQDTERLDELSIADDGIALRLRTLENDLVDGFVRGELSDSVSEQFRASFLASPHRRRKVDFADLLVAFENRRASAKPARHWRRAFFQWAPVAASLVVAIAAGAFFVENQRLRQAVDRSQSERAALEQTANGLRNDLERERSASARMRDELARRDASPSPDGSSAPIELLPMRRGIEQVSTVRRSRTAQRITFRLRLETDEFTAYEATLRDSSDGRVVWRSPRLSGSLNGTERFVVVQPPEKVLAPNPYTFELTGASREGAPAFVASYGFRVVVE